MKKIIARPFFSNPLIKPTYRLKMCIFELHTVTEPAVKKRKMKWSASCAVHVTSINSVHVVLEHFPHREYDTTETKRSMCYCVMETKQSDLSNKVRMMEPVWTKSNIVRHKPIFRVNIQE